MGDGCTPMYVMPSAVAAVEHSSAVKIASPVVVSSPHSMEPDANTYPAVGVAVGVAVGASVGAEQTPPASGAMMLVLVMELNQAIREAWWKQPVGLIAAGCSPMYVRPSAVAAVAHSSAVVIAAPVVSSSRQFMVTDA